MVTILLLDEVGGLQVMHGEGEWMAVEPLAGCFVVDIGNLSSSTDAPHEAVARQMLSRMSPPKVKKRTLEADMDLQRRSVLPVRACADPMRARSVGRT